ncbi:hypothetical protein [Pseudomonas moorei]|uniref:hypothetical protein n=1 Tax=Pseudomonas moorei TaxID=395599 RepID=UPI00200D0716|nr:hypothetical protein [Pseudomonas moorei]
MNSYSLSELLTWMDQKSKTLGWDAVVSYDQAKVNMLMEQQYVSKVGAEQIIPPISQRIAGPGVTNVVTGMVLGNPLLSFEVSDVVDPRARVKLTMPFLAGAFTTEVGGPGVTRHLNKMSTVVPGCGYTLTMVVNLESTGSSGEINDQGEVYLNLGEGVEFSVNFVETPEEQNRIGSFFKELYKNAPPEAKRFVLGMLDAVGDYALTPEKFFIRTQPAPSAQLPGSASYGVGAVVLFVKTKSSSKGDGYYPSSDFRYLIPNNTDEEGKALYSGTVLIRSRTLFKDIIVPYYTSIIGGGLTFDISNVDSTELACSLRATAGNYAAGAVSEGYSFTTGGVVYNIWAYSGTTDGPAESLQLPCSEMSIKPQSSNLVTSWSKTYSAPFRDAESSRYGNKNFQRSLTIDFASGATSAGAVSAQNNVVSFVPSTLTNTVVLSNDSWLDAALKDPVRNSIRTKVTNTLNKFNHFTIPQIDLFTLANLLFPENNALQLTGAYLPGDLACFGQLTPERSSFRIAPLQPVVVAGETKQFLVESPDYANEPVTWSVQAVADGLPGTIDANGLYRAPPRAFGAMAAQAHQDIVTATVGTGGDLKRANAVAVVVNHAITVNPAFKLCDADEEGGVELTATAQSTNVTWRMVSGNGTLDPLSGLSTTFTPTPPTNSAVQVSVIEARDVEKGDTSRSTILTLKPNTVLVYEIAPVSMEALGPMESQQLRILYEGNEENPTTFSLSLLSGGGTVSPGALYTAPGYIEDSCAVVWVTMAVTSSMKFYGYGVIPLKR